LLTAAPYAKAMLLGAPEVRGVKSVALASEPPPLVPAGQSTVMSAIDPADSLGALTVIDVLVLLTMQPGVPARATVTVTANDSVRTIPILRSAQVLVHDVNTGTSDAGDLSDLHVGDSAEMLLDKGGHAKRIVDAFGSRTGMVAAAASGQIVLDDGQVISPSSATTVVLNGKAVPITAIAVGDSVTERYNIDTFEPREVIATRRVTRTPTPAGPVAISRIDIYPARPLRAGDQLAVNLHGTPSGVASFDIGPYIVGQALQETSPGIYSGTFRVTRGLNFSQAPIIGHLTVHGVEAPSADSSDLVSVATDPPGIATFAPDDGAAVHNSRPSIYATFAARSVDVDSSSASLKVNGHDMSATSIRTSRLIQYLPNVDFGRRPMKVVVRVPDEAGNTATKSETIVIK